MSSMEDGLWKNYSPLLRAAHLGDLMETKRVLSIDPESINTIGGWNQTTALMLASRINNVNIVKYLLLKEANVNLQNNIGNSALILAAEQGHIEVVKLLLESGADVTMQNIYGQSALMLATENGHLEIVELLATLSQDTSQLHVRNKYDKTALLVAAQLGKLDIVKWILASGTVDVNVKTTQRGMSSLMYACSYSSDAHESIVDLLLLHGADVNALSSEHDTPLFWAAVGGRTSVVLRLINHGAKINQINKRGFTALMKAAERGHEHVVRLLIVNGADKWLVNHEDKDAMKLAWLRGHVEMATNVFMIDKEFGMLSTPVGTIFTEDELDELGLIYSNPTQFLTLKALVSFAAKHDFHFDLFIRLLPRLQTPNSILNKQLPIFYSCFYERSKVLDVDIVYKLVQLAAALQKVQLKHPLERIDFRERNDVIMNMLVECVSSDCMEEEKNIREILCFAIKWEQKAYRDELVEKAQTFRYGLLEACVRYRIKAIFSSGHISAYVSNLFWGFLRKSDAFRNDHSINGPYRLLSKWFHFRYSLESQNIRHLRSNFIHVRYCPAIMFIGEGFMRLITLMIITHLSVGYYFDKLDLPFFNWEEIALACITCGMILYEWGELCENDLTILPTWKTVQDHFSDVFNWFDAGSVALLAMWLVYKINSVLTDDSSQVHRMVRNYQAATATSAILLSLGLLRYLSLWEPLGKLTIMVFAMMSDLASLALFFLICIFGFCVALFSLFRSAEPFATSGQTALTLFSATLNNYDATFDSFTSKDRGHSLGIVIEVIYIVLSSVVLMNLVVARMAATHQKIDQRSFQEWQFATARTVKQFLLFEEKNPLCMLPAPLNLLPTLLLPIHSWTLYNLSQQKVHEIESGRVHRDALLISIAGSASDVFVGIVFSFIAPFIELGIYIFSKLSWGRKSKRLETLKSRKLKQLSLEPLMIVAFFPIIYPIFVCKLLIESCSLLTRLSLELTDSGVRRIVEFQHRKLYRKPTITANDADVLTIKILRGEKLRRCHDGSNVAVKVRLEDMELCTGSSIYRGCDPVFTNEVLQFPLLGIDLQSPSFGLVFEVVDRDILTEFETLVGEFKMSAEDTLAFLANGRFEERIELEQKNGYIVCVGKVDFPSFLRPTVVEAAVSKKPTTHSAKIRKSSYKESYASFRKRHSQILPTGDSPSPQSTAMSVLGALVETQESRDELELATKQQGKSSPGQLENVQDPPVQPQVETPANSDQLPISESSLSSAIEAKASLDKSSDGHLSIDIEAVQPPRRSSRTNEILPAEQLHVPSTLPHPSPIPTLAELSAAFGRIPPKSEKALSGVDGAFPSEEASHPAITMQYQKAIQVQPIFTLADKDRIFYHALRPKSIATQPGESSFAPGENQLSLGSISRQQSGSPYHPASHVRFAFPLSSPPGPHVAPQHHELQSVDNDSSPKLAANNLNTMSFINVRGAGRDSSYLLDHQQSSLLRGNSSIEEEDYDAFALANPSDIVI